MRCDNRALSDSGYPVRALVMRLGQRFEATRRLSCSCFSVKLREETDFGALNTELVGVARETMQPHVSPSHTSHYSCTPIHLRRLAEGDSNPIDEPGERMYVPWFGASQVPKSVLTVVQQ